MTYYRIMKHNGNGWNTVSGFDSYDEADASYNELVEKYPTRIYALRAKVSGRAPYIIRRSDEN